MQAALWAIAAIAAVVAFFLVQVLVEVRRTLIVYRSLEPKVIALLDNSRRLTANLEEVSRQLTIQASRIDNMTTEAAQMVDQVTRTVNIYNRAIARPAVMVASLSSGLKGILSALVKNKKEE